MTNHVRVYRKNEKGRDFFTTDLHGCYDLLHEKLRGVAFDSRKDILYCGGDWCDRGPDSKYVLDYLQEPWIRSVRANHEQMLISAYEEPTDRRAFEMLYCNGGQWFYDISPPQQKAIYEMFKSLPLAIELISKTEKKVGIVHAECPYDDWDKFKGATEAELKWNVNDIAQWSRKRYDRQWQATVKGVDVVLVGHTPTDSGEVEKLGNVWYCDGGSFFRNKINFFEIG